MREFGLELRAASEGAADAGKEFGKVVRRSLNRAAGKAKGATGTSDLLSGEGARKVAAGEEATGEAAGLHRNAWRGRFCAGTDAPHAPQTTVSIGLVK